MGNNTNNYRLEVFHPDGTAVSLWKEGFKFGQRVSQELKLLDVNSPFFPHVEACDVTTWHDEETAMKQLSANHPEYVFMVWNYNWDFEEQYQNWYHNGELTEQQAIEPVWAFPPYPHWKKKEN